MTTKSTTRTNLSSSQEAMRIQTESHELIKQLSEKLMNIVKISQLNGVFCAHLPIDDVDKKNGIDELDNTSVQGHKKSLLFIGGKIIKLITFPKTIPPPVNYNLLIPRNSFDYKSNSKDFNNNNHHHQQQQLQQQQKRRESISKFPLPQGLTQISETASATIAASTATARSALNSPTASIPVLAGMSTSTTTGLATTNLNTIIYHSRKNSDASIHSTAGVKTKKIEPIESMEPVFLKIWAKEDIYGVNLSASVVNVTGKIDLKVNLNVRLPSIALVDREAAEQFALNLTNQLYLEFNDGICSCLVKSLLEK
jgi:hypothetical protein